MQAELPPVFINFSCFSFFAGEYFTERSETMFGAVGWEGEMSFSLSSWDIWAGRLVDVTGKQYFVSAAVFWTVLFRLLAFVMEECVWFKGAPLQN